MNLAAVKQSWVMHVWDHLQPYKNELDFTFVGLLLMTLLGWLPHITTVVTLVWSCIRLYETKTVQAWLGRRRARRARKPGAKA
jgi:hypothetical protein